jgi:hypothetical protein
MGWDFGEKSKEELVTNRTRTWDSDGTKAVCLAHCVRGKTLWTVWEVTNSEGTKRFVGCDLLDSHMFDGELLWGYKDMCESVQPYNYDCPLAFLEMVPVASEEWRAKVRAHAAAHSGSRMQVNYHGSSNPQGCLF